MSDPKVFFTSDTHFDHVNITGPKVSQWESGYRNFDTTEEMNEVLIKNWNEKIGPFDTVYHLGDVSFGTPERCRWHLSRLNGIKHLILGNHDKPALANKDMFASVRDVKEIKVGKQKLWLSHYAHRVWNKSHHGVWHLYGHSHDSLPDDPTSLSFDIGVDCHAFSPLSFEEVSAIMAKKKFAAKDHHGA